MKVLIILIFLSIPVISYAELPPQIEGENFQRPELVDCQQLWTEKMDHVHKELQKTTCLYNVKYYRGSTVVKEVNMIIEVDNKSKNKKTTTHYLNK